MALQPAVTPDTLSSLQLTSENLNQSAQRGLAREQIASNAQLQREQMASAAQLQSQALAADAASKLQYQNFMAGENEKQRIADEQNRKLEQDFTLRLTRRAEQRDLLAQQAELNKSAAFLEHMAPAEKDAIDIDAEVASFEAIQEKAALTAQQLATMSESELNENERSYGQLIDNLSTAHNTSTQFATDAFNTAFIEQSTSGEEGDISSMLRYSQGQPGEVKSGFAQIPAEIRALTGQSQPGDMSAVGMFRRKIAEVTGNTEVSQQEATAASEIGFFRAGQLVGSAVNHYAQQVASDPAIAAPMLQELVKTASEKAALLSSAQKMGTPPDRLRDAAIGYDNRINDLILKLEQTAGVDKGEIAAFLDSSTAWVSSTKTQRAQSLAAAGTTDKNPEVTQYKNELLGSVNAITGAIRSANPSLVNYSKRLEEDRRVMTAAINQIRQARTQEEVMRAFDKMPSIVNLPPDILQSLNRAAQGAKMEAVKKMAEAEQAGKSASERKRQADSRRRQGEFDMQRRRQELDLKLLQDLRRLSETPLE